MGNGLRNDFNTEFDPKNSNYNYSRFTQQEGCKKRTAKRLCVTNVTRLLLPSFVVIDFA